MIRVLIADDHAIVRNGLKQLILEEYHAAVIGEADDAEALIEKSTAKIWDVVLCDLSMPGRSGLEALKQIKQTCPDLPVLIMSMYPAEEYATRALKAGASGFLCKDSIHDELIDAIQTVLRGKKFIPPSVAETLVDALDTIDNKPLHEQLSDREFDVFKLLAAGKRNSDIASNLSISVTTVSTYRSRILKKMSMTSNAELTRYAVENGLI
jgi:two-component system invasion response regulator UvrY